MGLIQNNHCVLKVDLHCPAYHWVQYVVVRAEDELSCLCVAQIAVQAFRLFNACKGIVKKQQQLHCQWDNIGTGMLRMGEKTRALCSKYIVRTLIMTSCKVWASLHAVANLDQVLNVMHLHAYRVE